MKAEYSSPYGRHLGLGGGVVALEVSTVVKGSLPLFFLKLLSTLFIRLVTFDGFTCHLLKHLRFRRTELLKQLLLNQC